MKWIVSWCIVFGLLFNLSAQVEKVLTFSEASEEVQIDLPERIDKSFWGISVRVMQPKGDDNLAYKLSENGGWISFQPFHDTLTDGSLSYSADLLSNTDSKIWIKGHTGKLTFRATSIAQGQMYKSEYGALAKEGCSCESPQVCFRNCWCTEAECPYDDTPVETEPTHIIVHHSAGNTQSQDYGAVVRYIYDFHTQTNGWDDVGYNWLIDPNGTVYEGRPSGLQGAHFSCMNQNTVGICLIGNYETNEPTQAALNSLKQLIASESCSYGLVPSGFTWHESAQMQLGVVSGHRDGNFSNSPNSCASGTVCPGDRLFNKLTALGEEVAAFPCLSVGVHNQEIQAKVSLRVRDNFIGLKNLFLETVSIKIVDSRGCVVKDVSLQPNSEKRLTLASGLYILMLEDGGLLQRFVVSP